MCGYWTSHWFWGPSAWALGLLALGGVVYLAVRFGVRHGRSQ